MAGQFTYTSYDPGGDQRGGWQVQSTTGDVPPEVAQALRQRIATRLDTGQPVPPFPTLDEVAKLPRRLTQGRAQGGFALWHTVPAGADAAGRPGNVFVHVVYVPDADRPQTFRFIDLWRSPDWLTPFGQDQIRGAALAPGASLPRAGSVVSAQAVAEFFGSTADWKRSVLLGPVVDAAVEALSGGAPVVLGVAGPDEGAQWIGVVSHLVAAPWAARLTFSTLERAETVGRAIQNGTVFNCVPRADLAQLDADLGVAVIDSDEVPRRGQAGPEATYITAAGSSIRATPLSALAREVVAQGAFVEGLLAEADELDRVIDPLAAPIGQSLARAVLNHPDRFPEALEEARALAGVVSPVTPPRQASGTAWADRLRQFEDLVESGGDVVAVQRWLAESGLASALLDPATGREVALEPYLAEAALKLLREAVSDLLSDAVHRPGPGVRPLGWAVDPLVLDWLGVARHDGGSLVRLSLERFDFLDRERLLQLVIAAPDHVVDSEPLRRAIVDVLLESVDEGYATGIGLASFFESNPQPSAFFLSLGPQTWDKLPQSALIYPIVAEREGPSLSQFIEEVRRRDGRSFVRNAVVVRITASTARSSGESLLRDPTGRK